MRTHLFGASRHQAHLPKPFPYPLSSISSPLYIDLQEENCVSSFLKEFGGGGGEILKSCSDFSSLKLGVFLGRGD